MRFVTYFFLIILIIIGISFAGLNAEPITLNYYIGTAILPLSLLLVLVLISGCVLGLLGSVIPYFKLKRANRHLRQRLKLVEEEVANLRAIPLKNE